jgi:hypothetical protein
MHLNQLYGLFGRSLQLVETKNIYMEDLPKYLASKTVKSWIEINDEIGVVLLHNNINKNVLKSLNIELNTNLSSDYQFVKSNVALAAAVTAYARIHMRKYKLNYNILYTDTDSILTTVPLPECEVGKKLGQMKDELNGKVIAEGYFLGIKQYGNYYLDDDGKRIEKSVFAGISLAKLLIIFRRY